MGQAWIATTPAGRPTLRKRLSLRRHLSRARNRRGAGPTLCRHIRHAASPGRDIPPCRQGRARCPAARSRRLAYDDQAPHAEKHYADLPPIARAGTQPGLRTSGNICAATGFPTACSTPTTPSSTPHARLGESSSLTPKQSPQSESAIGRTSVNLNDRWYKTEWIMRRDDPDDMHGLRREILLRMTAIPAQPRRA
jgi:hypothetical protein